ncbi:hypothetical protein PHSY_002130 [Pseudozyma hubeiensis SY62]|uniref:Uncharacterized protein n=1 Tax=Pseudozyma hubeiensis (strain SY62) TaxID=1305764 RepID=R9P0I9_PSEHS|nr:hypothetical protein PHSY_002130 [Pseudozyma hubeiensis SY62]GAC94557.1 hypothetical protein PHSY_002130 [Pseudozyma hubeiensis SY62]
MNRCRVRMHSAISWSAPSGQSSPCRKRIGDAPHFELLDRRSPRLSTVGLRVQEYAEARRSSETPVTGPP